MKPSDLIMWATFAGVAWILFSSITGADEWLKSIFGTSALNELNHRVAEMETRMEAIEKSEHLK